MPIDLAVQLDDMGVDFTTIDDYQLFLIIFATLKNRDTSLIFGDLDLSNFEPAINENNNTIVLLDRINDIVIDKAIFHQIASSLRKLHGFEKNTKKPANDEAKAYMLERARVKQKRLSRRKRSSSLEPLIVAAVNTEQFKYDFEGAKNLTIYQFNQSLKQIIKKIDYDNRMHGVYAGTLDVKGLSTEDLTWISSGK